MLVKIAVVALASWTPVSAGLWSFKDTPRHMEAYGGPDSAADLEAAIPQPRRLRKVPRPKPRPPRKSRKGSKTAVLPPIPQRGSREIQPPYVLIEGYGGQLSVPWDLMRKYGLTPGQRVPPETAGQIIEDRMRAEDLLKGSRR